MIVIELYHELTGQRNFRIFVFALVQGIIKV
jgi:hypothetical protein